MALNAKQKKFLKGYAHHMRPLLQVGKNGCSVSLIKEFDHILTAHELVKVRVSSEDQESFLDLVEQLKAAIRVELVHKVGHTAIFFRANPENPKFDLRSSAK